MQAHTKTSPELQRFVGNIVQGNPNGVMKLAYKYGYYPPSNKEQMEKLVYGFIHSRGDESFKDLALIHPDRGVILATKGREFSYETNDADGGISTYTNTPTKPNYIPELKQIAMVLAAGFIVLYVLSKLK